ncbi:MAG: DUF3089 domain-containing protein [Bacteroidales bacterium]|jgi:hypothetical protein|nr:DUF3089 domain-containing protein [Bacteroidales bacterium]
MKKFLRGVYINFAAVLFLTVAAAAGCGGNNSGYKGNKEYASSVDYAERSSWAYCGTGENRPADVFLVCPTVFLGKRSGGDIPAGGGGDVDLSAGADSLLVYNMSLNDSLTKIKFSGALNMERGIYEESCKLYAPYYRQCSLSAYSLLPEKQDIVMQTAYSDVRKAFLYYMDHFNNNRPFVLAGFSQGSEMCIMLMKDLFAQKKYEGHFVAAYAIGWRVTKKETEEYPQLKMASGEKDTGVIITFSTEAAGIDSTMIVPHNTLSINPLNWKTDGTYADKSMNEGACFTDYSGNIVSEKPHLTGAYITLPRGTLVATDIDPDEYPPILSVFQKGVYHLYDYQFFYRNLQKNVGERVNAFLSEK